MKYLYRPYHSWRHGFRREKIRAFTVLTAKILLIFELAALAVFSFKEYSYERELMIPVYPDDGGDGADTYENVDDSEIYGIGFERGNNLLFWFHRSRETDGEK